MGDSGSQMLGFALAALGLASSWRVAGTTVATLVLPILILAVPILDTALVTSCGCSKGGRSTRAAATTPRTGSSASGSPSGTRSLLLALIATGIGALEPRLQRARQRPLDDRRRRRHVRAARAVRELPRRHRAAAAAGRRGASGFAQAFAVHWRRLVEVLVDFAVITGSFLAAYAIVFGWPGHGRTSGTSPALTLPILLAARYLAFIPFGLYRSVWRYAGARDAVAIASAVVVSEVDRARLHGADAGHAATSRAPSSSSTR